MNGNNKVKVMLTIMSIICILGGFGLVILSSQLKNVKGEYFDESSFEIETYNGFLLVVDESEWSRDYKNYLENVLSEEFVLCKITYDNPYNTSVPSFLKVENGNIIGSHSVDKDLFPSSYEYFLNMNKAEFKKEIYEVINSQP